MVAPNSGIPVPNGAQSSTTPKPAAPVRAPRMTLQSIVTGKVRKPLRILVYGVDGVGKTTFAASAPKPIIVPTEEGANELDVAKFPVAQSFDDMREAIRTLTVEKHDYKTAVIDSLDWAESLVFQRVVEQAEQLKDGTYPKNIEEVGGGFFKGQSAAVDVWRVLLNDLERLQREKNMHLIFIAHSKLKNFKNPQGEDFERYSIKLDDRGASAWREWCSGVYFANFEILAKTDKRKRVRGVSTGSRFLHTLREGAFDAKDRYGLPERLPLSWDDFWSAYEAGQPADPAALEAACREKAAQLGGEDGQKAIEYLARNKGNAIALAQLNDRLNAKLGERAEQQAPTPVEEQTPTSAA